MPIADRDAAGIGALADPIRRRLYEFVSTQPTAASREQAAEAVEIPVHQAKFHLDKLEAEGLLIADYARLHGRSGPGAGRPSKLYRRTDRDIAVSLPDREYQLAGQLMADAIAAAAATGAPVIDTLHRHAHARGRAWGESAIDGREPPTTPVAALALATEVIAEHGYEPRHQDGRVVLANCPFHQLAKTQTELVCQMNHALLGGLTEALQPHGPAAELDPGPDRCCVVLHAPA
ncbi:transcriptional regulator [Mycobacterium sp. 21AC1]|uniref:helix-turn-helix transcriptional regulator n=1 Tax=[Mycobacterium] appelbergii TaxID=2939269 RepID=UPI002938E470|nr:helix-turn-helix domain-containing protein [Mycobacterium sp. 21AC1]MDV3130050.1 transcriptional regulator [Mycobacterium sp. 21AC1]